MNKILKQLSLVSIAILHVATLTARENVGNGRTKPANNQKVLAGCNKTTSKADLDINNVRTTILAGGDLWWDLDNGKYEIPKNGGRHCVFAGSIWVGGYDGNGNLKAAAQTYRQNDGNDFWSGPISSVGGVQDITSDRCNTFDRHWKITRSEVNNFASNGVATSDILEWPGSGNISNGELKDLAPYVDVNGNGFFDSGTDYPRYFNGVSDLDTVLCAPQTKPVCDNFVFGDQTIWWVFNDVGGVKTETTSQPIGLEVRAQGFAFATNDAINNMTFYKYQVINRSNVSFDSTYFGQWVDPDLGDYNDDYVGCDVGLGLGFVYNGDADDGSGTATGYGFNPPALGVDFFQGPLADPNDGIDNDKDGTIDECGEELIMSNFLYYDNVNLVATGNPEVLDDYYQYLSGSWCDGNRWTRGLNGYNPNSFDYVNYIFPGTTDPAFPGSDWSEITENNTPADRRFLQSAGPFNLQPGAVNYITTGVVWARATSGGPSASVSLMKIADAKAQALFDNCFKPLDGPNAPKVAIREYSNKLILALEETENINSELYNERKFDAPKTLLNLAGDTVVIPDADTYYKFQGFKIYQVANATVRATDLSNPDLARLIHRVDIKDDINQIVNYSFNNTLSAYESIEKVSGSDVGGNTGIKHTFVVTRDAFTGGKIINHQAYYFLAVSYAYNNYYPFEYILPSANNQTQTEPYLEGRLGWDGGENKPFSGIPHDITVENGGMVLNSEYGSGVKIKRIEGQGNGGIFLNMTDDSRNKALVPPYVVTEPVYTAGNGPIGISVYDPLRADHAHMEFKLDGVSANSLWYVFESGTGSADTSMYELGQPNEQIINTDRANLNDPKSRDYFDWGLTARISNADEPTTSVPIDNNGFIGATLTFGDGNAWLTGVKDTDGNGGLAADRTNWILSGDPNASFAGWDDDQVYEGVLGGTWAPYRLTYRAVTAGSDTFGVKFKDLGDNFQSLFPMTSAPFLRTSLASVDVVITPDKSKWTRCPVVETGNNSVDSTLDQIAGGTPPDRFGIRKAASVDKNGNTGDGVVSSDPNDADYISATGMGWFPGYAINVDNGERLNMAFGENSAMGDQNGTDMLWNPTSVLKQNRTVNNGALVNNYLVAGGMHYVYVFGHNDDRPTKDIPRYDAGEKLYSFLSSTTLPTKRDAWKDAMWVTQPVLTSGNSFNGNIPPGTAEIKLRVGKKYRPYPTLITDTITATQGTLTPGTTYFVIGAYQTTPASVVYNGDTIPVGSTFTAVNGVTTLSATFNNGAVLATVNGANPKYEFETEGLLPTLNVKDVAVSALDKINVVPNPYYAYSSYDKQTNDQWVKITNLPAKCVISVYTLNGTLVRRINRDEATDNSAGTAVSLTQGTEAGSGNTETSFDWDLKNQKNVPVSSGVYLIHISAPGIGEKTVKWFGMMRPIDLDSY